MVNRHHQQPTDYTVSPRRGRESPPEASGAGPPAIAREPPGGASQNPARAFDLVQAQPELPSRLPLRRPPRDHPARSSRPSSFALIIRPPYHHRRRPPGWVRCLESKSQNCFRPQDFHLAPDSRPDDAQQTPWRAAAGPSERTHRSRYGPSTSTSALTAASPPGTLSQITVAVMSNLGGISLLVRGIRRFP